MTGQDAGIVVERLQLLLSGVKGPTCAVFHFAFLENHLHSPPQFFSPGTPGALRGRDFGEASSDRFPKGAGFTAAQTHRCGEGLVNNKFALGEHGAFKLLHIGQFFPGEVGNFLGTEASTNMGLDFLGSGFV